jgi:LysM repeat protein
MAGYLTTTVKPGETLENVADRLGLTREELAHDNGLGTGAGLRAGQTLKYLPTGGFLTYTVQRGQSLQSIADSLKIDVVELAHANGLGTGAGLRTGQVLQYKPASYPGWAEPVFKVATVTPITTPSVQQVAAGNRTSAAESPPNPAVWQPWAVLADTVNGRFQVEITEAVKYLNGALKAAGKVLDGAVTAADTAAAPLEAAAMTAYAGYMSSAATTRDKILTPAYAAYDKAVADAHGVYQQMLTDAENTYKQSAGDVSQAAADGQMITGQAS